MKSPLKTMNVQGRGLCIYLFGPFQVVRNGEVLSGQDWPQRKAETLLKLLVSQRGKPFTQDQLIDLLFADLELDKAVKSLYNRISELRRVLEPGLKRGNHSTYILRVGPGSYCFSETADCWVDAQAFELAVAAAYSFKKMDHWSQAAHHFQQALELYQGIYMADDPYEEWTLEAREDWADRHARVLLEQADCHARLKQHARAIEGCRRVIRLQPTNEQAYRQLMTYAAQRGDARLLMMAYQDCQNALWAQLEVKPAAETSVCFEACLRQLQDEPRLAPPLALQMGGPKVASPLQRARKPSAKRRTMWAVLMVAMMLLLSAAGWWGFSQLTIEGKAPSIAVLPFVNIGVQQPEGHWFPMEDFADGATMELANALSQIPGLKVASTTSTFSFKGKKESIFEIGNQLNVTTILEGSLRRAGNRLRITLQLIDVQDGLHRWSGRYEADILDDSFAMLDELIPQIVEAIAEQLEPLLQRPSHSPFDERLLEQFKQFFSHYIDIP